MSKSTCRKCNKSFQSAKALSDHNFDRHNIVKPLTKAQFEQIKFGLILSKMKAAIEHLPEDLQDVAWLEYERSAKRFHDMNQ